MTKRDDQSTQATGADSGGVWFEPATVEACQRDYEAAEQWRSSAPSTSPFWGDEA